MTEIQYIAVLESEKRQLETFKASVDSEIKGLERRIEELKEQNTNLQIMLKAEREVRCNEDYLKRVCELEEQIEKMKNCWNCKNWNWKHGRCQKKLKGDCFKASKWESKE